MVIKSTTLFQIRLMRVRINIEYDGTKYVGWQKQKNGKSIQGEIEACLFKLYKEEIKLFSPDNVL